MHSSWLKTGKSTSINAKDPPLPVYSRGGFYTYAVLRIRAGVAVFHLAAQLIQHFVQCVGSQAADGIGHGFVGLLAQGGAGGGVTLGALGIVTGVDDLVCLRTNAQAVALNVEH